MRQTMQHQTLRTDLMDKKLFEEIVNNTKGVEIPAKHSWQYRKMHSLVAAGYEQGVADGMTAQASLQNTITDMVHPR